MGFLLQRSQPLAGRTIVLADSNAHQRHQLAQLVVACGAHAQETSSLAETVLLSRALQADIVLLDSLLDNSAADDQNKSDAKRQHSQKQIENAIKAIHLLRVPALILKVDRQIDRSHIESAVRCGIHEIMLAPCRLDVMLQRLAEVAISRLPIRMTENRSADKRFARSIESPPPATPYTTRIVPQCNALLQQGMLCPFHKQNAIVSRFILRTGKVLGDVNYFDIPTYESPSYGADFINYNDVCISICPECHFASINPEYFITPADRRNRTTSFDDQVRAAMNEAASQRAEIASRASNLLFTHARTTDDAEIALELATHSALTLSQAAPNRFSAELMRLGNYHLRKAELKQRKKASEAEIVRCIDHARSLLKDSFAVADTKNVYKNAYQLIASSIYFGEDNEAQQYLKRLREFEKNSPPELRAIASKYLSRSSCAWEDRDENRASPWALDGMNVMAPFAA